jgi:hypothetical protein
MGPSVESLASGQDETTPEKFSVDSIREEFQLSGEEL